MDKMRIGIISDSGPPYIGGGETYVQELSKELVRQGHEVHWIFCRQGDNPKYETDKAGIIYHRIKVPFGRKFFPLAQMFAVPRICRNLDLLQFNSFFAAITGRMTARFAGKPAVLMVHEFFQEIWKEKGKNIIDRNISPLIEKYIASRKYKRAICPSEYTKRRLVALGIEQNKVDVIYHGIDHSLFKPSEQMFRKKYNLKCPVLGWCGRMGDLSWSKNLKGLLEAFKKVAEKIPSAKLLLAGSGYEKIEPMVQKMGLTESVIYAGVLKREELPLFYSSLDAFMLSSLSEGFCFVAVEAQACGTPVIAFPAGALPEVVKDGKTGFITDGFSSDELAEKAIKFLEADRPEMRKNAEQWAKQFTWEESAKRHIKVYESVLPNN